MESEAPPFREANLGTTPIRDLGLTIAGTDLASILGEFEAELAAAGIHKPRPRFYLSTEWGVPFGTVAIAIPFYLARRDLTDFHARRGGLVEGVGRADVLRYLRHEMGHVLNYAYRLYEEKDWVGHFGDINQDYEEEYHPEPFSPRYVDHLPGWYAQKHPDEDWAETFAVWLTPGRDWRAEYASQPVVLAKLEYCDRTLAALRGREPLVSADELDEDVSELNYPLEQFYDGPSVTADEFPRWLDGALREMFEGPGSQPEDPDVPRLGAADLIDRLARDLSAGVYRWTGHFPERTYRLLRHLAGRAGDMNLVYPRDREAQAAASLSVLLTTLAMNSHRRGV